MNCLSMIANVWPFYFSTIVDEEIFTYLNLGPSIFKIKKRDNQNKIGSLVTA